MKEQTRLIDIGDFISITTPEKMKLIILRNVIARRKERKISQIALAEKAKVSYGSIRRFEKTGEISLNSLLKIALALDCIEDFREVFSHAIITNLKDYQP
ncbi:MAG: helix-turn-helix domain-containing protein [Bacilli bacterium]|nr:helix-turn-helix domain-containing protein [Bacilli bacterium]MCQ2793773.1 helix-turn-helix domain-containing protein [Bacilli bacterium]